MTDLEADETGPEDSRPTTPYQQTVQSAAGFAYGVIGADLHVFGDGVPLYLLLNWQGEAAMDSAWLRRMPSRMLNARFAVVPFTGRGRALEELRRWRDDDRDRLSIRWLHSEGGSGKSRLAARLCGESAAAGWKVIVAVPGPGGVFPPPGSQDLSADGADGLLLLVDYADRWPETHLAWLLSNALLHRPQPRVRVLMIARTISPLPRLRAALADQQVEVSSQHLPALPADAAEGGDDAADPAGDGRAPPRAASGLGQRADMFRAARAAFAERYGIADPDDIAPPGSLDQPEMGLVLAVHMAALVAVDARHNRQPPPTDYTGLSLYLLDREYRHWQRMHGDGTHELDPAGRDHRTSPATMQRIVFAATLTGPLPPDAGSDLLGRIGAVPGTADPAQALADHGQCYPPAVDGNGTVFEPLYPDRLAEDFLALTLPGHRVAYPHQEWASGALGALLARSGPDRQQPWWTGRVLSFLIAAGDRWPHVRAAHLYPLLARDPRLAVDGGSSVLTGLAGLADVGPPLLTAVKQELLRGGRPNLQTGVAAVIERLAPHELSRARTDRARDDIYGELWLCLWEAGQYGRSITALQEAIAINRRRAHPGPAARLTRRLRRADTDDIKLELVNKLINLSSTLLEAGEPERAMAAAQEGLAICPELSDAPHVLTPERTAALQNISRALSTLGRADEALAVSREIVDIRREQGGGYPFLVTPPLAQLPGGNPPPYVLARDRFLSDPGAQENGLATALANLAIRHAQAGDYEDAVASMAEALRLRLDGSDADQSGNAAVIAADLSSYARMLGHVGRLDDATAVAEVAVSRGRALAEANSARYEPFLANALASLSQRLEKLGRRDEAAAAVQEAIQIGRRHPGTPVEEAQRVVLLSDLARFRSASGAHALALADAETAVARLRALAGRLLPHEIDRLLGDALSTLGRIANDGGEHELALAADDECVAIARHEVQAAAGDVGRGRLANCNLALELSNRSASLARLGRRDEAFDSSDQALTIFRLLAAGQPAAHEPDLARVLANTAGMLTDADRYADARALAEEAVAIYRRLAEGSPAVYERSLARALDSLDTALHGLGLDEEATAALAEAAEILGRLAAARPGAHDADLAQAMKYLGRRLNSVGQHERSVATTRETADLYRRLAAADPARYGPDLADVISDLSIVLSNARQPEQSLSAAQEAAALYRGLVAAGQDRQRPQLGAELRRLTHRHLALEQYEGAFAAAAEAVRVYRDLAQSLPDEHWPELAAALDNAGGTAWYLNRTDEALAAVRAAADVLRRLAHAEPPAGAQDLTRVLVNLAVMLLALDRHEEALVAAREAVSVGDRPARPDSASPDEQAARASAVLEEVKAAMAAQGQPSTAG